MITGKEFLEKIVPMVEDDSEIWIDEDGSTLHVIGTFKHYYEIGGDPSLDEDEEHEDDGDDLGACPKGWTSIRVPDCEDCPKYLICGLSEE